VAIQRANDTLGLCFSSQMLLRTGDSISANSLCSVFSIDLGEGVWYHLSCVTGDRGGYGSNALGEILG